MFRFCTFNEIISEPCVASSNCSKPSQISFLHSCRFKLKNEYFSAATGIAGRELFYPTAFLFRHNRLELAGMVRDGSRKGQITVSLHFLKSSVDPPGGGFEIKTVKKKIGLAFRGWMETVGGKIPTDTLDQGRYLSAPLLLLSTASIPLARQSSTAKVSCLYRSLSSAYLF